MDIIDERIKDYAGEYLGCDLLPNEYLLKIRKDGIGFLAKLTQKGDLPKAFSEWGEFNYRYNRNTEEHEIPIKVIEEDFATGWELNLSSSRYDMYRIGKSQQWVKIKHPFGFVLEIHLENFFLTVLPHISNGKIKGEWKWVGNRIEKK